jgi:hypothetical protein
MYFQRVCDTRLYKSFSDGEAEKNLDVVEGWVNSRGISTINTGWSSRSGRDMVESVIVAEI